MTLYVSNIDSDFLLLATYHEEVQARIGTIYALRPEDLLDRLAEADSLDSLVTPDIRLVIIRLLGGLGEHSHLITTLAKICESKGVGLLTLSGELVADPQLHFLSTFDPRDVDLAFSYLCHGGPENFLGFFEFVSSKISGDSFPDSQLSPPKEVPRCGVFKEPGLETSGPCVAVLFYRALYLAGNTLAIENLIETIGNKGYPVIALYAYSLRGSDGQEVKALLSNYEVRCIVTTMWAAGGTDSINSDQWRAPIFEDLGVPVVQAIAATGSEEHWENSSIGLSPIDVAMSVAIPEFDGRIISVPASFKEIVDEGRAIGSPVPSYRSLPDRLERVAGLSCNLVRLAQLPNREKKVAIILSSYPTKKSRIGNAVGLDSPASTIGILTGLAQRSYQVESIPDSDTHLMEQLVSAESTVTYSVKDYLTWFYSQDETVQLEVQNAWGDPPGGLGLNGLGDSFCFGGIRLGTNVYVGIQPARGYGENPVQIYHSPDLPPTHHYLAFYRWIEETFGANCVVHVGKHGNLEWLPGKGVGLSKSCFPDLALGNVPVFYPFVVNDPGEGAQAKRRSHATIIDHLVPPMTRAGTYGDVSRVENLLDEHARISSLDPKKLPAIREQLWEALVEANLNQDLGLASEKDPGDFTNDDFDGLIGTVDGYLCELKDAQIRGGLHVLGVPPIGEGLVDLIVEMTRIDQGSIPSLRRVMGEIYNIDPNSCVTTEIDLLHSLCVSQVEKLAGMDYRFSVRRDHEGYSRDLEKIEGWICNFLVPALKETTNELSNLFNGLEGKYIPPGPSGAPTRGMAHVLPTGRNFYSIDPRSIPSRLSFEVGRKLAQAR